MGTNRHERLAIGYAVCARRHALGISRGELARRSGVRPAVLAGIERASHDPSIVQLAQLSDALSLQLSELIALGEGSSRVSAVLAALGD